MKKTLAIFAIALLSCNNEKPAETTATSEPLGEVGFQSVDSVTKSFVIPDSINTALIIATYVEIDPECHTLLVYTDNTKKKAVQIRYLNEGGVITDKLDVVSETLLRSKVGNEFHISDSTILFKPTNGHSIEHFRTDANN
ncbi:MAG: hypothetical protein SGJ15_15265 [Bacteroidota bacterium]|nr:hypothetical protein [Bacteroidota bacterium]